ncbi:RDD family protein [uncultured Campylobacter sp.]|uniref:RDD family protein n=1 Tax=uncultured Campylobacter sp. TaxID=218934 RepID=UPI00262D453C|nr:RDD family protein [uncultured Campylobacter sp.]
MKQKAKIATRFDRFKAFVIDIFLIYVPILYISYFLLGSKEAFLQNQGVIFICSISFGILQAVFFALKAQSPGLKAYDLYIIDSESGTKLNFLRLIYRYILFILSLGIVIGLFSTFFRKDGLMIHDLLSSSCIVHKI